MSSTDTNVQGLQGGEGGEGGGAGARGVTWADTVAVGEAVRRDEKVVQVLEALKSAGGYRGCSAKLVKDGSQCPTAGSYTNGAVIVCGKHTGSKFLSSGGPVFAETIDDLIGGSESKEDLSGGTPEQRQRLRDNIAQLSPQNLNSDSTLSGLHLQPRRLESGPMTLRSASASASAAPATPTAGQQQGGFKSTLLAAHGAVHESRPLVEQQSIDADAMLPGWSGDVGRAGEQGALDGVSEVASAGGGGVARLPCSPQCPPQLFRVRETGRCRRTSWPR